ncbi:MAG TPA: DUF5127 domain-containing protein, partial [Agriterribacter sp.]|nr:DUF5127 domain-containing protein [Agriterribacter sp.]
MKKLCSGFVLYFFVTSMFAQDLRPPAYPLITHDPYFSIWSFTDDLNASPTKHWTGKEQSLVGLLKVDGKPYRFMGNVEKSYSSIIPAGDEKPYEANFTEADPGGDWMNTGFDDASWKKGLAPFGDNPSTAKTTWKSHDIWVRRIFDWNGGDLKNLFLKVIHDDNAEIYLNGEKIYDHVGWLSKYTYIPLSESQSRKLVKGKNILAIHVANTAGGASLDVGIAKEVQPAASKLIVPALQTKVALNATQTTYEFACGKVNLNLTFTSPLLMDNLDLLSRPVSYITAEMSSKDGAKHQVSLYFGASTALAVNNEYQGVVANGYISGQMNILKAGTREQPVLQKKGDDLRIDWGYMYVAVPEQYKAVQYIAPAKFAFNSFLAGNFRANGADTEGRQLMLNTVLPLGEVGSETVSRVILLGYDDGLA